jgi:hypothetical protein
VASQRSASAGRCADIARERQRTNAQDDRILARWP